MGLKVCVAVLLRVLEVRIVELLIVQFAANVRKMPNCLVVSEIIPIFAEYFLTY